MNLKKLIIIIIITFAIGTFPSLLINNDISNLNKPFEIPKILFPIVWSILYLLMSISYYLVSNNRGTLKIYGTQLIVNSFWTIIFFGFELRLFAFIWILLLIGLVIKMTVDYFKINKVSAYLLIPYLLWLLFAAYLNISIYILN